MPYPWTPVRSPFVSARSWQRPGGAAQGGLLQCDTLVLRPVVVSSSPLALSQAARCRPAMLRLECLLTPAVTPAVVREERDIVRMSAWGRHPATRVRGGWGHTQEQGSEGEAINKFILLNI